MSKNVLFFFNSKQGKKNFEISKHKFMYIGICFTIVMLSFFSYLIDDILHFLADLTGVHYL